MEEEEALVYIQTLSSEISFPSEYSTNITV